jgi:hypothetical protein
MKTLIVSAGLAVFACHAAGEAINFDSDEAGKPPSGWTCGTTGKGNPRWAVEAERTAPSAPNVLKQSGIATFPWCVVNKSETTDGAVEVKFKAIAGKQDQAGGLVWRWKDSDNYYVARANALEKNVSLYYTVNGVRKTIQYVNAPVALNTWHTLRVAYQGEAIQVALDGTTYIDRKDTHISGAGKVGVWTKADSMTLFDDFGYNSGSGR